MNEAQREAYILAKDYNFLPDAKEDGKTAPIIYPGMFEQHSPEEAQEKTITIASYRDKSNLMIKYRPADLQK